MSDGGRGGRRKRPSPLSADLIVAIEQLRARRASNRRALKEDSRTLRELLGRVLAAGYAHREAAKLLGVSYATVQTFIRTHWNGLAQSKGSGAD